MVALVGFVSLSVSIALVWLAAVVSYFAEGMVFAGDGDFTAVFADFNRIDVCVFSL